MLEEILLPDVRTVVGMHTDICEPPASDISGDSGGFERPDLGRTGH
jgi:hypothetical protein